MSLFIVDAKPFEDVCTNLSDKSLKENAKILAEKIKKSHPDLVMNINEISLDYKKNIEKIKVINIQKYLQVYQSIRGESHITFVPIIGIMH